MKKTMAGMLGIVLCGISAFAVADDLLSIYREAQERDSVYASAHAAYEAGLDQLKIGRAGLLPTIAVTGNTQINDRDLEFSNPADAIGIPGTTRYNSNTAAATLTQPLFRVQNWATYLQSKAQASQAEAQFRQASEDLITRVAQAYFDVMIADDALTLATRQKEAINNQLHEAKRNFEIGTVTISDANDAQARYDLAVAQEISARTDLEVKRRTLGEIIGGTPPVLAGIDEHFPLVAPDPEDMDAWAAQAADANPQVIAAQFAVNVANREVDKDSSGHLPTLDAVVAYNNQAQGSGPYGGAGLDTKTRYVGVQFSVPIFSGGLVYGQVKQALDNLDKAKDDLESARRTAMFNAQEAYVGAVNGIAQVKAFQAAIISNQRSLDSSKVAQKVGIRTQVDVLNAEQQLITAQNNLIQALYGYVLNMLKLKSAAGALTEDDIAYINTWLSK